MRIPMIRGVIQRRILLNYRIDPGVLSRLLPNPFRPKLADGFGIGGICLIRLSVRPPYLPSVMSMTSENAAHRFAVEWDDHEIKQGVYVPRRDTSSWLNTSAGGRLFPGVQHHARFAVNERGDQYEVRLRSDDAQTCVAFSGRAANAFPGDSVFSSVDEASSFFEGGSMGYSEARKPGCFDGLELRTFDWSVTPVSIDRAESSFFADEKLFPPGSVAFDSALLMREVTHEWHSLPMLSGPSRNCECQPA